MELYRKNILIYIGKTFVGTVIDIDKCRDSHLRIQMIRIHHITVVL